MVVECPRHLLRTLRSSRRMTARQRDVPRRRGARGTMGVRTARWWQQRTLGVRKGNCTYYSGDRNNWREEGGKSEIRPALRITNMGRGVRVSVRVRVFLIFELATRAVVCSFSHWPTQEKRNATSATLCFCMDSSVPP